jgi:phosphate transport system substrate-binding protein
LPFEGLEVEDSYLKTFSDNHPSLIQVPIAKDAFVFFGEKNNPVNSISLDQIRAIYSGKITNWLELGGKTEPILAYQRPWGLGSGWVPSDQDFMMDLMKGYDLVAPAKEHRHNISGYSAYVTVEYKNYSNALGYCFRWVTLLYSPNRKIKLFAIDGVAPTEENIRDGSYPLSFEIVAMLPNGINSPETEAVMQWLTGPEGQSYIRQLGYVPLRP